LTGFGGEAKAVHLALAGLTGMSSAFATLPGSAAQAAEPVEGDAVARTYLDVLHAHTRWVSEQWNENDGFYSAGSFAFASVLGNAVLLGLGDTFDQTAADTSREVLLDRTVKTIKHFTETNRLAGGDKWGQQLFWDSTWEVYFVLAARLLWNDLDPKTRAGVEAIARGQAAYVFELGATDDPMNGDNSTGGTLGGWHDDTKLDEMSVYAQSLAPALAWSPDDAAAHDWQLRFLLWNANASGLPAADRANPATIDGVRISDLVSAHNLREGWIVENGEVADPFTAAELWRSAGRSAVHLLAAGRPLPEALTRRPGGDELWATLRLLASDAGEPVMPMSSEHYHQYGRSALPLAFLSQVLGDRHAARAEADLADRLLPFVRYEPANRLTKVIGEGTDEVTARCELAVAYLLHKYRKGARVAPVTREEFFAAASGTRDFGPEVGLVVQQTPAAFAAAVTKPEHATLLWQPNHDNWLVDTRVPAFLPPEAEVKASWQRAYRRNRDGVDATATVLALGAGHAGFTTLPTGSVVYASTGLPGEGTLRLFNTYMAGVPGLGGTRTFTSKGERVVLNDQMTGDVKFSPRKARYVRMMGREAATEFGYSIYTFAVLDKQGADLAQGAMPVASSEHTWYPARYATDGNPETRWAVAPEDRAKPDNWIAVDLGSPVEVAGVHLLWEAAYARSFLIQTSVDAVNWTDVASVPQHRTAERWAGIDGRAGIVTLGGDRTITLTPGEVRAKASFIEGYPGNSRNLAALAARTLPSAKGLIVSDADGYLSVFNLSARPVTNAPVTLPGRSRLYLGEQAVKGKGLQWRVTLDGARAAVEAPRFTVEGDAPEGTVFRVADSHKVTVQAPAAASVSVTLRAGSWSSSVRVSAGKSQTVTRTGGVVTPVPADLARGRDAYPSSPLPPGMTAPGRAVDGDPATSWRPGESGRMVVDLGSVITISGSKLTWTSGTPRPWRLEGSQDGVTYAPLAKRARYVAVVVDGWRPGDPELVSLVLT
jgi:hypothetical protein